MDDKQFKESLAKQNISEEEKSAIRMIANNIILYIEDYDIVFNPLEKERLSLYILHYSDSIRAAAHIYPIKPALERIPDCINNIAQVIEKTKRDLIEEEFKKRKQEINQYFQTSNNQSANVNNEDNIERKTRKRKISNIKNFIENNNEKE